MHNPIQTFLNGLAATAAPDYQKMLTSIAEYYDAYGTLSKKQRTSVRMNASIQKVPVPIEFEEMKTERDAIDHATAQEFFDNAYKPLPSDVDAIRDHIDECIQSVPLLVPGIQESFTGAMGAMPQSTEAWTAADYIAAVEEQEALRRNYGQEPLDSFTLAQIELAENLAKAYIVYADTLKGNDQ